MKSKKYAIYVKKVKTRRKVRDHCYYTKQFRGAAHSECNLRYKMPKEIPVVFHNGSTYDYNFITKKLVEEFECLGENTEKYFTFSVSLKKENNNGKKIAYKLKFIDTYRFMSTSLSNLVDNLSGVYDKECKRCMERKKIRLNCEFDKDVISLYLMYLDANNLYGWAMSQKLPVNGFKWVEKLSRFNKSLIRDYDENSDIGYFLEVDIDYPEKLFNPHKDLPFLPERKKVNKVEKLICSTEDKEKFVIHIRVLKQALNYELVLRKVHKVIQFNQEDWLKPYTNMNTKLRKEAKNDFEKDFFKLVNNSVFGKTMENVRKHRDIELLTTDVKRNKLVFESNYHKTKRFSENLVAIEMEKTKVKMNKHVYLRMLILHISKTLMHNFW